MDGIDSTENRTGMTKLMRAVTTGEIEKVRQLLSQGVTIDMLNPKSGFTALRYAIDSYATNSPAIVQLLLDGGADLDKAKMKFGNQSPLFVDRVHDENVTAISEILQDYERKKALREGRAARVGDLLQVQINAITQIPSSATNARDTAQLTEIGRDSVASQGHG